MANRTDSDGPATARVINLPRQDGDEEPSRKIRFRLGVAEEALEAVLRVTTLEANPGILDSRDVEEFFIDLETLKGLLSQIRAALHSSR